MPYTRTWRETGGASETGGPFESVTSKPCKVVHTVITKTNTLEIKLYGYVNTHRILRIRFQNQRKNDILYRN